jgi:hypothetical protein
VNYYRTLIAVADDCPVTSSAVPATRGGKKTVAVLQYEMLTERPYRLTQEDVLFDSWLLRQPGNEELSEDEVAALREDFFAKDQPCLRTSPLPKKYGFGLLFDSEGRVALCPVESEEYGRIVTGAGGEEVEGEEVEIVKAMRSSRR